MKIVLIYQDTAARDHLVEWLENTRGHVVLFSSGWPSGWFPLLVQHDPDLVLLPDRGDGLDLSLLIAFESFPGCQFRRLSPSSLFTNTGVSDELEATLVESERIHREKHGAWSPYADEQRFIFHDEAYQKFASTQKLHVPRRNPGWEAVASDQECRFLIQLQTAKFEDHHQRAKQYYATLRRFDRGLTREVSYRLAHGSYKIVWLREQIARWLTVLAHYIPDVEIEHCPGARNSSPRVDFIYYEMPPIFNYAVCSVLAFGIRASVADQIKDAVSWKFEGQPESQLITTGCLLFGINAYLAQVAQAQVWSMSHFLAPESSCQQVNPHSRNLRRTLGIFFEFWGWEHLWNSDEGIREITRKFHSGETRVDRPSGVPMAPTFTQFRQIMAEKPLQHL